MRFLAKKMVIQIFVGSFDKYCEILGKKTKSHFLSLVKVVLFIEFKSEIQILNGLYQVLWEDHLVLDMMKIFQGKLCRIDLSLLWLQWAQVLFTGYFYETNYFNEFELQFN